MKKVLFSVITLVYIFQQSSVAFSGTMPARWQELLGDRAESSLYEGQAFYVPRPGITIPLTPYALKIVEGNASELRTPSSSGDGRYQLFRLSPEGLQFEGSLRGNRQTTETLPEFTQIDSENGDREWVFSSEKTVFSIRTNAARSEISSETVRSGRPHATMALSKME